MKIAMFAPYFAPQGGGMPNYYEYWQKAAAENSEIDFFIPTNLDVSGYKKYDNIHYIILTADEFWDKVQALFDFPISRTYYKSAEYRPLFGVLFKEYIRDYDYWGSTEFDVIYGDILKFIQPFIDRGADVIGRTGPFRIIRNTEKICNIPFVSVTGFKRPLTLDIAFSNSYCWYFDEAPGMEIRYYQSGIESAPLEDVFADIDRTKKPFRCAGLDGDLGFVWKDGKLIGYNDRSQKEFLAAHFQKRRLEIDGSDPERIFCIVPNRIINGCEQCMEIHAPTFQYSVRYYRDTLKRVLADKKVASPEYRKIWAEIYKYCEKVGIHPKRSLPKKLFLMLRRALFWK